MQILRFSWTGSVVGWLSICLATIAVWDGPGDTGYAWFRLVKIGIAVAAELVGVIALDRRLVHIQVTTRDSVPRRRR